MEKTSTESTINAPIVALDLGQKRVGAAVSDSLSISVTRLAAIPRTNWKQLLRDVANLIQRFDAKTVVIGLPLRLNGSNGEAATEIRRTAQNFARSLDVPVYLQDERLTSFQAEQDLMKAGHERDEIPALVDSESAALILRDFLQPNQKRILIPSS